MATAGEIANNALKHILTEGADSPLAADEYADFYRAMNLYMASLEARGIRLGYSNVTIFSDEVTIPDGALFGLETNMAIIVAADYSAAISMSLANSAKQGFRAMRKLGQNMGQTVLPRNLPLGSGSSSSPGIDVDPFRKDVVSGLITLAGNTLVTAMTVAATPYKVNGHWEIQRYNRLQPDLTGRIVYTGDQSTDIEVAITGSATAAGASAVVFYLYKNGVATAHLVAVALSTTAADFALSASFTINPGEYLELWVENSGATHDITVASAQWEVS